MAGIAQVADCQFFQALGIPQKLRNVFLSHVLLSFYEVLPLGGCSEPGKEISFDWMTEKSILSFPAVVVHTIPKNAEIEVLFLLDIDQEQVLLVVSMSVDECYHALNDLGLLSFVQHRGVHEAGSKHLINISANGPFDFAPGNTCQTLLLNVWVKCLEVVEILSLKVLVHSPEASPQEKEIELFSLLHNLVGLHNAHFGVNVHRVLR